MKTKNGTQIRILFVDQSEEVRDLYESIFAYFDCEVFIARTASEGLHTAQQHRPHVIYASLMMEDATGFEFASHLRTLPEFNETVLVAITGYSNATVVAEAKAAGFDDYFLKPVDLPRMLAPIRKVPGFLDDGSIEKTLLL